MQTKIIPSGERGNRDLRPASEFDTGWASGVDGDPRLATEFDMGWGVDWGTTLKSGTDGKIFLFLFGEGSISFSPQLDSSSSVSAAAELSTSEIGHRSQDVLSK